MAEPPPYTTPRWVKTFGIIVVILVLLLAILHLTGVGGNFGPGRHMPSGDTGTRSPSDVRGAVDQTLFGGGSSGHTLIVTQHMQQP